MPIKFGPAGIGPVKNVEETFERYKELGLKAAEIPFTYSVYIKSREVAKKVGDVAEENGIRLSVHAPYWINLNSKEDEKIEASKKRILNSAEVGHWLGQSGKTRIVFHCGFYTGMEKDVVYENVKKQILEMKKYISEKNWDVELCPEIMGKKNVFGSIDEISKLSEETGCGFCVDFAHALARYGEYSWEKIKESFSQRDWHCHFSGIEYGEKGERKHKATEEEEWKKVLNFLEELDKEVVMINEADDPVGDSVLGLKILEEIKDNQK